jgi:hypothetical protein
MLNKEKAKRAKARQDEYEGIYKYIYSKIISRFV